MDKYDYIDNIVSFIKGVTGINYQLQIGTILKYYYSYLGKVYEMPDFYGGDRKNDGWVKEDKIFYQIFAPTRLKDSLKKEIENKFKEDLEGLLKIIYEEKKWKGEIKKYIFIVNTFDINLPPDDEDFFENTVVQLKKKYNIDFDYRVCNSEYIREILEEISDIKVLEKISATLRIRHLIDKNAITETMIIDLIEEISGNLNELVLIDNFQSTYERVSSSKKIKINNLNEKRERIEDIISKLDVVEKAVNTINQDVLCEDKFERVKQFIVNKYSELASNLNGVELYDRLIEETLSYTRNKNFVRIPMEFLIVYIFDKCDIFEKE
ncbi:hypothetical protein [Acetivibrio clariflavus]|uniref:Uncharacterized protein n=1 Tax=Acetivibrio clariflavus (strain DSM 19732 / NBRC 101661 / EBR45) TaxID=720554 RepID=G8LSE1_ACECE|nr:hypothetical protein [Acetivibrio clariflavus]AEV67202.1 hypothetical protein Clocl_0478 [Acetivibrio clariflavus DSM 19732]